MTPCLVSRPRRGDYQWVSRPRRGAPLPARPPVPLHEHLPPPPPPPPPCAPSQSPPLLFLFSSVFVLHEGVASTPANRHAAAAVTHISVCTPPPPAPLRREHSVAAYGVGPITAAASAHSPPPLAFRPSRRFTRGAGRGGVPVSPATARGVPLPSRGRVAPHCRCRPTPLRRFPPLLSQPLRHSPPAPPRRALQHRH